MINFSRYRVLLGFLLISFGLSAEVSWKAMMGSLYKAKSRPAKFAVLKSQAPTAELSVREAREILSEYFADSAKDRLEALRIINPAIVYRKGVADLAKDFKTEPEIAKAEAILRTVDDALAAELENFIKHRNVLQNIEKKNWRFDATKTSSASDGLRNTIQKYPGGGKRGTYDDLVSFGPGDDIGTCVVQGEQHAGFPCKWHLTSNKAEISYSQRYTKGRKIRGEVRLVGEYLKVPAPQSGNGRKFIYFKEQTNPPKSR